MSAALLKLRPEVKALWLAALNSGEYTQCQGRLQDARGFCCLGVLSDLHSKSPSVTATSWREDVDYADTLDGHSEDQLVGHIYGGEKELPPKSVMTWAFENYTGTQDSCVSLVSGSHALADTLAGMNDSGKTFAEIAEMIDKVL